MNTNHQSYTSQKAQDIVKGALVAALYVALSMLLAPLTFGPLQIRLSEGLNYLGLYNKRYVYSITLGVFIVNYFSYGIWDMLVGSIGTYVFLLIGRALGDWIVNHYKFTVDPMIVKYAVLAVIFSLSMFTIATLVIVLGFEAAFWPTYGMLAGTEFIAMAVSAFIVYPISKRINFDD